MKPTILAISIFVGALLLNATSFAKNEEYAKNLSFIVSNTANIPKDAKQIALAIKTPEEFKVCQLFFQPVPFQRSLKKKDIFVAQSAMEDEKAFDKDEIIRLAGVVFGVNLEPVQKKTTLEVQKYLEEKIKRELQFSDEVLTARFQLQSKKTERGAAIECWNMDIPEALEFLSQQGPLNPSTDL